MCRFRELCSVNRAEALQYLRRDVSELLSQGDTQSDTAFRALAAELITSAEPRGMCSLLLFR